MDNNEDLENCENKQKDVLYECIKDCDNMDDSENVNSCEVSCVTNMKVNFKNCPCQVFKKNIGKSKSNILESVP